MADSDGALRVQLRDHQRANRYVMAVRGETGTVFDAVEQRDASQALPAAALVRATRQANNAWRAAEALRGLAGEGGDLPFVAGALDAAEACEQQLRARLQDVTCRCCGAAIVVDPASGAWLHGPIGHGNDRDGHAARPPRHLA